MIKITNRKRWENTKDVITVFVWTGLLALFAYRAANDISTEFDLLSMVIAVAGWRMAKMIVEADRD
jgi:uncharacterized membrane protein